MPEISLGVGAAAWRGAVGINGREIVLPLFVFDVDNALGGVDHAVPGIAGGHHAVEHVNAAGDAFQDIFWGTDAHKVPGFVCGQDLGHQLRHSIHVFYGFANREAADGIAFPPESGDGFCGYFAQFRIRAALNDGEKRLGMSVKRLGIVETLDAAREPAVCEAERFFRVFEIAGIRGTFIESHDDIRADDALDVHHIFRGKVVFRTIYVALKRDAFFFNLSAVRQGIHLESAAVGEYRAFPAIETVNTASFAQYIEARAQVKVVGIAQANLRLNIIAQFVLVYSFYRRRSTNRHKNRGLNLPVVGGDESCAGAAVRVGM